MARTTTTATQGISQTPEPAPENLPAPRPRSSGVSAILPTTWQEVTAIAGAICRAGMAPKSYCKVDSYGKLVFVDGKPVPEPDKVAIALMHGMEVGFAPMAALQSIAVINGMPSIYGDGMLALIRASGLLEDIEETMEWDKEGPVSATCKMWRKGEKTPSIQTYTRDDAMEAKLWNKAGPWTDHKPRMLQWRARGWCGRDKFADVLRGLHIAEEVMDMVDVTPQGSVTTAPPEPKRADFTASPDADDGRSGAGDGGHGAHSPAPGGGNSPSGSIVPEQSEAAAAPAHDKETGELHEEPDNVTDVADLNEPEPLVFERYKTFGDLIDFSERWLQEPGRTRSEAMYWHAFYATQLEYGASNKYPNSSPVKQGVLDLLALYGKIIATQSE